MFIEIQYNEKTKQIGKETMKKQSLQDKGNK